MPFTSKEKLALLLLIAGSVACLVGFLGTALALLAGIVLAMSLGNPVRTRTQAGSGQLMKAAIIGMGFGLPLDVVLTTARSGLGLTVMTISLALLLGMLLTRLLRVDKDVGTLLSVGTAICGGSAIAAVAPVIKARSDAIVIAVAVVFLLNGLGLLIFPPLGHFFGLSQSQFGLWAALAIHDTSSVVGAGAAYGDQALQIATTAKLARAVWIIPLVFGFAWQAKQEGKPVWPLFIGLFLLTSLLRTLIPAIAPYAGNITILARHVFALSLFWIGAGLTQKILLQISLRPLLLAVILWLSLSSASLMALKLL